MVDQEEQVVSLTEQGNMGLGVHDLTEEEKKALKETQQLQNK